MSLGDKYEDKEKQMNNTTYKLLSFINCCPSPWHTVNSSAELLEMAGFCELCWTEEWNIVAGGKYYIRIYGSTLVAFSVGYTGYLEKNSLRIVAAHTDFPGFRVKPSAGIVRDGYGSLNVESYGGVILQSWLDRPLSIAGRVMLKGKSAFEPIEVLMDFDRPLMTIPSLAIHMNRKVNDGVALNKQKEMLPIMAVLGEMGEKSFFDDTLANELGMSRKELLSYELNIYPYEGGCQLGIGGELVSAPRLDNLTSVYSCLEGISLLPKEHKGVSMAVLFDNEEIGSRTKQGADSAVLLQILERIYSSLSYSRAQLWQAVNGGFMFSVDVAHGIHPNYQEKSDPTNRPVLNGGVVLKQAASQSYAGDAEAVAVVSSLCQSESIPYQHFVNRSDSPGGSTLGSIASALVPMRTMDIGVPILAMHSARETMGALDQVSLNGLIKSFLKNT